VVVLRPWQPGDAPVLVAGWALPDVQQWTGVPDHRDEAAARRWIDGTPKLRAAGLSLDLLVVAADDGRPLGEVGLSSFDGEARSADLGWWVLADERGSGVAARAVGLLAPWALAPPLSLAEVRADVDEGNAASRRVAERTGLVATEDGWVLRHPA
jgi:RimJ/RimL family protein N-acetyltransferase